MIIQKVAKYIEQQKLFGKEDKLLVALSGGADSVALLHILTTIEYNCEAAHCNFHLRGEESDRDETFVKHLCAKWNIPLHITHFQTTQYAAENKISVEMAARELRYQWFKELRVSVGAQYIATGHHQDDSVETVLINLIRGTGINGLLGIRPKNEDVVRPLLILNREEILHYLHTIGQDFVTDSTNLQDDFTRNKIRLNILPAMKEINPAVMENIVKTTNNLRETAVIYTEAVNDAVSKIKSENGISISALLKQSSPRTILFEVLHPLGFNSSQIEDVYNSLYSQSGKFFVSHTGARVIRDREELIIEETTPVKSEPPFTLHYNTMPYTANFIISKQKHIACFDTGKLETLSVRKWEKGDYFIPFGMKGKKLVSDFLTEKKFSLPQKENQWVLCSGEKIAWVIGERTDDRFRIDENTKEVTIITMETIN